MDYNKLRARMKKKFIAVISLFLTIILLCLGTATYASHIYGLDFLYTYLGGNNYKVTLVVYGNCAGASFPYLTGAHPTISVYDSSSLSQTLNLVEQAPIDGIEVTPVCPAEAGNTACSNPANPLPGIKKFVYTGTVTIPTTSANWRFVFSGTLGLSPAGLSGNITNIINAGNDIAELVDTLNNMDGPNSSPVLTNIPTPFYCDNLPANYNPGAVDSFNTPADSLAFMLVPVMDAVTAGPVNYVYPYSATAPLNTSNFSLAGNTGQLSFTPAALQNSMVQYNIDQYRNGVKVGTCQRLMTFVVLNCSNYPPSGAIDSASAGTIVDSTDFIICQTTGPFTFHINPTELADSPIVVTAAGLPPGSTFTITGNGTPTPLGTFSWNTTDVPAGTYTFYLTYQDDQCPLESKQVQAYSVTIEPSSAFTLGIISPPTCYDTNATFILTPNGLGSPWQISILQNGNIVQTINNVTGAVADSLVPGAYAIRIAPANDPLCSTTESITFSAPVITPIITSYTTCGHGGIIISGLNSGTVDTVSYTLNGVAQAPVIVVVAPDDTVTINNFDSSGIYDNIVVATGTCVSSPVGPDTLLLSPGLIPGFTYAIHYGCHGDTVVFTNTSQFPDSVNFRWDFGDHAFDTTANTTHIYTYQDTFHVTLFISNILCEDSITDTIPLIHPIKAGFTISGDTLCQGQPITFTNTSTGIAPTYVWSFGDGTTDTITNPTHTYNNTGPYHILLTETDFVPCHDTASASVQVDSISGITLTLSDSAICDGMAITAIGTYSNIGNTSVTWNFGDGYTIKDVNTVQHSYDTTGTFTITLSADYRTCPDTSISKKVNVYPYPAADIGPDTSMCPGQPFSIRLSNLIAQVQATDYTNAWSTGDTTASITVNTTGTYWLTVITNEGCSTSDTMVVKPNCYLDIPNAFTPNGDGVNDYFFPRQFLSDGLVSFKMVIYNRWGELIFATTSIDGRGWDGKFNNVPQPQGVFVYIIDAAFKDGNAEHYQGNVTLLR